MVLGETRDDMAKQPLTALGGIKASSIISVCSVLSASAPLGLAGLCRLMGHDHLPQLWKVKRGTAERTIFRRGGTGAGLFSGK